MKSINNFKELIFTVRGVKVMLDADLAEIYGYTTSAFNQQVKNNIEKFDDDFRFQLTKEEYNDIMKSKISCIEFNTSTNYYESKNRDESTGLISKNFTSKRGGTRKIPFVFTEQGIFVIDNYIGMKTLVLLKNTKSNIAITLFTDNIGQYLHHYEYEDFCKEYPDVKITFHRTCGIYHDRYIILDYNSDSEHIYHCGSSSKDAGNKVTTISEVTDRQNYHPLVDTLLNNPILTFK